jgi:hypothetical protein
VSYSVLDHSRKPVPVYVGKNKFESLTVAAEFLSEKTRSAISTYCVRNAIDMEKKIGGLVIMAETPIPPRKKKKGRGFEDRKIKKALADLAELGIPIEGEAKPLAIHEHVKGTPLLVYPPGAGPLYRGRRVW